MVPTGSYMRRVVLGTLLSLSAFGQAQKDEYSVTGVVRNAVTGEPVRSALVSLAKMPNDSQPGGPPAGVPEEPLAKALLSGPGGEFRFEGLPAGLYFYDAKKPGFVREDDAAERLILPTASPDAALQVNLTPLGAIDGKVVNQFDEPMENVALNVYSLTVRDGEKTIDIVNTLWTDDRGLFHLSQVSPGNYYVKLVAMKGGTETHFGAHAMRYAPWEGFSPVYFGGAAEIASADPIPVTAGIRARADFHLTVRPIFKIRGKVQGYAGPEAVNFELLRGDERAEPSRALFNVSTEEFEVLDVPPGVYKLRATQEETRGEVAVNVGSDDVSGVSMVLLLAPPVKGIMRSVGGRADAIRQTNPCGLELYQRWYRDVIYVPRWQENGQFSMDGVFPGEYRVRFQCFGAYVQSASFGGADLLTNPVLTIPSDAPPPSIEINYTPGGGSLEVKLTNPIPPPGGVLLVPAFPAATGPELKYGVSGGHPSEDMYLFSNLAPGDYSIYVLSKCEGVEFRNPAFLRTLSGGTSIRIEDGKTAEVTITGSSR
jgi:hypothetical protein